MDSHQFIQDITDTQSAIRLTPDEKRQAAAGGNCFSDTETTGRPPQKLGLTEVASQRVVMDAQSGALRHEMFQAHILPWRPQIQDYFAAVNFAKENKLPPPVYDRRKYEYRIDPRALAVTGAEFVREPKDGPITAMKINGKRVRAFPFYEVKQAFLAFNAQGAKECFYNSQFDARVLADQIADVESYALATANRHQDETTLDDPRLRDADVLVLKALQDKPYAELNDFERREVAEALKPLAEVLSAYTDSSQFHCLMLAYLAEQGFSARNRLDDAHAAVYPDAPKRAEHKADEDVTMAAQVGLWLARQGNGEIPDVRQLFERLVQKADPLASVERLPPRDWNERQVAGDLALKFSAAPEAMGPQARKLWDFIAAFGKIEDAAPSGGVPRHLLQVDAGLHRIDLNAERQPPLTLNFLKKLIFFSHLQDSQVIDTLVPHHSAGTVVDVVLKPHGSQPSRTITDVHYASLRANRQFIETHPDRAADYLALIAAMRKADPRVGMVLLRERSNGALDIILQGHVKAFGEVVIRLAPGTPIPSADEGPQAFADLQQRAEDQMRLGAIPHVTGLSVEEEDGDPATLADDNDEIDEQQQLRRSKAPVGLTYDAKAPADEQMQLVVSEAIFTLMALRLHDTPQAMASRGYLTTTSGKRIQVVKHVTPREKGQRRDTVQYQMVCARDTFHEFVDLRQTLTSPHTPVNAAASEESTAVGERPSNLIKDASWLLYRLEQIPGTYGLHLEGNMAVLEQRDGVDVEALGLLQRVGIPYKAYGDCIKVDAAQLMKNAFHWSVALSREQKARNAEEDRDPQRQTKAPPKFLESTRAALVRHPNCALEVNEARQYFLVDGSVDEAGQENHYPLDPAIDMPKFTFHQGKLVPWRSDLKGIYQAKLIDHADGTRAFPRTDDNAVLYHLVAHQLEDSGINLQQIAPAQQPKVTKAIEEAARFMLGIAKSTRSQRLPIDQAELSEGEVLLQLPQQQFIAQPSLFMRMLDQHQKLAGQTLDQLIRDLHKTLPDPVLEDSRRSDPKDITDRINAQREVLLLAYGWISKLQDVLGGEVKQGDSLHLNPPAALQRELETLGTLLHELSSSGAAIKPEDVASLRAHIDTAQGLLSNVAYGHGHMREHFSVAGKTILSKDRHCLWAKLGEAMAQQIGAYATQAAYTYPDSDLAEVMEPFQAELLQYFDISEAAYRQFAYRAALRELLQYRQRELQGVVSPDERAFQQRILTYLIEAADPEFPLRSDVIIDLYREGATPEMIRKIHEALPFNQKSKNTMAERVLWQFKLLSGDEPIQPTMEAWWRNHPEEAHNIDDTVKRAFAARGKQYLTVARLNEQGGVTEDLMQASLLRLEARDCFLRAGWGDERIAKEMAKPISRTMKEETKHHVRARVALEPLPLSGHANAQELKKRINLPGHEERLRLKLRENAYATYESEVRELIASREASSLKQAGRLLSDARDTHAEFKLSHVLLDAVAKLRKETMDVRRSKPHHLRDLQAAIALGDQDDRVQQQFNNDEQETAVGKIIREVKATPEEFGLTAETVAQIHGYSQALNAAMQQHALAHFEALGITPEVERNQLLRMPYLALENAFDQWRKAKKHPDKDLPYGLKKQRIEIQHRLKALPQVVNLDLRHPEAGVKCTVWLPEDVAQRQQAWDEVADTIWGLGVRVPQMPASGGQHEVTFSYTPHLLRQTADATRRHLLKPLTSFVARLGVPPTEARDYAKARLRDADSKTPDEAHARAHDWLREHYGEAQAREQMLALREALGPLGRQR